MWVLVFCQNWDRVTVDKEWRKEIFENSDGYSISYWLKENAEVHFAVLHRMMNFVWIRHDSTPQKQMSERASIYENCLCNNWLEHSPVSLLSRLPYNCSRYLQRDTDWGGQSYLPSACQLLDTSWSGRLGRTCVCALWFHIHSLQGSCTLCYLWWHRQGKRCSESLTNQHHRYTKVLIQLLLYSILEFIKGKQCYTKGMPLK